MTATLVDVKQDFLAVCLFLAVPALTLAAIATLLLALSSTRGVTIGAVVEVGFAGAALGLVSFFIAKQATRPR